METLLVRSIVKMPIIVKDYKWKETYKNLTIQIPLNSIHQSKVDIFYCEKYLKAIYEQFFFEVFFYEKIDTSNSNCTLTSTEIVFELSKSEPKLWGQLEDNLPKNERQHLKKQYIEEEHVRIQERCEEKRAKKNELKRVAVREQIELDTKQRNEIEQLKQIEQKQALSDLKSIFGTRKRAPKEKKTQTPIRSNRTLYVNFTAREFPTPIRESRIQEENEWLAKQAEARRSAGFISEDIRPEERNPQFLKAKGDDFLKNGNYLGAISAYSYGIKISKEKLPDLFLARSEAHLAVGNYGKLLQDSSKALELYKPTITLNLHERALCLGRRGIGLIKLGLVKEGIGELEASLKLETNEDFERELNEAKNK